MSSTTAVLGEGHEHKIQDPHTVEIKFYTDAWCTAEHYEGFTRNPQSWGDRDWHGWIHPCVEDIMAYKNSIWTQAVGTL